MTMTDSRVDNGVNVEALIGAREALTAAPEAAQFRWRATCKWMNGTHSRSTVDQFYGLGGDQKHRTEFSFEADHPEIFASEDHGATPVEYVLVGLGGCLTAGDRRGRSAPQHPAALRLGDARGYDGHPGHPRHRQRRPQRLRRHQGDLPIDADATPEEIRALVAQSQKRSAVYDIVTNPTNVSVEVN